MRTRTLRPSGGWRQVPGGVVCRFAPWIAAGAAIAATARACLQGTTVVGGADVHGYVSQAFLWAGGRLRLEQPVAAKLPWPFADAALAPLGYTPASAGHAAVPVYAPGFPILMALAERALGRCGPFVVVPRCARLAVWLPFALGRRFGFRGSAAAAAVLVSASPTLVYQSLLPMSDVPVAALWFATLVLLLGRSISSAALSGITAAIALLVRPNLLLVAVVL